MLSRMTYEIKPVTPYAFSEINVTYTPLTEQFERPKITRSRDAYDIFMQTWDMNKIDLQEQFKIMCLDRQNRVIGVWEGFTGCMDSVQADVRLSFAMALKTKACGMILAHNHPSRNLTASTQDCATTRRFKDAGRLLDISVEDHLIVTPTGYFSFSDDGIMP